MLDKATANVLSIVNEQCKDNNYIVMKDADITPKLNKKVKLTSEGIKDAIQYLAEREYIKLKYAEEGTFCLSILPKGRLFEENEKEERYHLSEEKIRNVKFLLRVIFLSGLCAFVGAMAGVIVMIRFIVK